MIFRTYHQAVKGYVCWEMGNKWGENTSLAYWQEYSGVEQGGETHPEPGHTEWRWQRETRETQATKFAKHEQRTTTQRGDSRDLFGFVVLMQYAARCRPGHAYEETIAYRGKNLLTGLKGTLLDAHISHHCTVHKYLVLSFQKVLLGRSASQMTITNIAY